jgi:nucleotide-binding universal stress UspA family protein/hemerythrin-like domain-containing protein
LDRKDAGAKKALAFFFAGGTGALPLSTGLAPQGDYDGGRWEDVMSQPGPDPDDPLVDLLSFHSEIRKALGELEDLAHGDLNRPEARSEARDLLVFINGPLLQHDVDEELSLMPRLRATRHPARLEKLLDAVSATHVQLENRFERIRGKLRRVANGDAHVDQNLFSETVKAVGDHILQHLRVEEEEVYPLARLLLSEEDLQAISKERAHRAASSEKSAPAAAAKDKKMSQDGGIVVGIDGSEVSFRALDLAADLAQKLGVNLDVLTVVDLIHAGAFDGMYLTDEQYEKLLDKVREEALDEAKKKIEAMDPVPEYETHLVRGHASKMLIDEAQRHKARLLVIGRTGKGAFDRLIQGSVANHLASHSPVPVLVVP